LRHLPWEVLFVPGGAFVCTDVVRPVAPARQASSARVVWERSNRPLRVLFMASSPVDVLPVLAYEVEEQRILAAAGKAGIELVVEESGSLAGLQERIREHDRGWYDVIHLTGHADVHDGRAVFLMESETGEVDYVDADRLVRAVGGRWPRVVFVSGCRTGTAPQLGVQPSFAEQLVRDGASCVLGWGQPVGDVSATVLAAALYEQLGVGESLDVAIARARSKLFEDGSSYWHLLRSYVDGSSLGPVVTPSATRGRARLRIRKAELDFLDPTDPSKSRVCPGALFVGRRRELQRCLLILTAQDQADAAYREGIVIHGMGGLGKSSLAARLCSRLPDHKRLVWYGEIDEGALLHGIAERLGGAFAAAANQPGLLHHRLAAALARSDDPIVFVLDDFERNLELDPHGAPLVQEDGRAVVRPAALAVLAALLAAIRDTGSPSRVVVTCRYQVAAPAGPTRLGEVSLERLAGADLTKKTEQLAALSTTSTGDLREHALAVADGNPRVLEWCDVVLATPALDPDAVFSELEGVAARFRENVLVAALLAALPAPCRMLLGRLAVCHLPVDEAAVDAIARQPDVQVCLQRAVASGLVELGRDTAAGPARYRVPVIVSELTLDALPESDRTTAGRAALEHLYRAWWQAETVCSEPQALELLRLALNVGDGDGDGDRAATLAEAITNRWINAARYHEAVVLCAHTLDAVEDYRIRHNLARAQEVLGDTVAASTNYERALVACPDDDPKERSAIIHNTAVIHDRQGHPARALKLYEQSLAIDEQIGEVGGKAATLHAMAGIRDRQGDTARALKLYEQSLAIKEQIGDVGGKAATLHQMAGIHDRQGDPVRALKLYEQSLAIKEQIGDTRGKAATLHAMAGIHDRQGDPARALKLYEQSLAICEQIGDVVGKASTLHAMAGIHARHGDPARALKLHEQSLAIKEQMGNVGGKAATLHEMADIHDRQGDPARALKLYEQSLAIKEQIGDARGKAATLHQMAGIHDRQGDPVRALKLYEQSLAISEQIGDARGKASTLANIAALQADQGATGAAVQTMLGAAGQLAAVGAWPDLVMVLTNLGALSEDGSSYFAQAVWLASLVAVPLEGSVSPAYALSARVGAEHDAAPLLAIFAVDQIAARQQPPEQMVRAVNALLDACLQARGIADEDAVRWLAEQTPDDAATFSARLREQVASLVTDEEWVFERSLLPTEDG